MVKIVFVCYRLPELTTEGFQSHWRGAHADLVRQLQETVRIRRYVQSYTLDVPLNAEFAASRAMATDSLPDGIAEAWYDTVDDMQAGFRGPEGERAARLLMEDEAKFVDHKRSFAFMTEEATIASSAAFDQYGAALAAEITQWS
jgi:uncharacterized protein (TIGR02118 family)